ncbi:MAG: hypothetical protein K2I47_05215 [Odoribacter sp.]|nr:hypothetical protein [Odoribacter sp.]
MNVDRIKTIYNNYDLWEDYAEAAKEVCEEDGMEVTEYNIWTEIYRLDEGCWEEVRRQLATFFQGRMWLLYGYVMRWNGRQRAGFVFTSFWEMFQKATKDQEHVHIFEQGNRMFLECLHHDGTNFYEIRKITEKGCSYLKRWEKNWAGRELCSTYMISCGNTTQPLLNISSIWNPQCSS